MKIIIKIIDTSKKIEPRAWIKKYFIPIKWELIFFSKEIIGTKANILISIKLQINKLLVISIPIKDEKIRIIIKKYFLNHEIYLW